MASQTLLSQHTKRRLFMCEECGQKQATKTVRNKITGQEKNVCSCCDSALRAKKNWIRAT